MQIVGKCEYTYENFPKEKENGDTHFSSQADAREGTWRTFENFGKLIFICLIKSIIIYNLI